MLPNKFRFIWPSGFRGEDFFKSTNQKQELPRNYQKGGHCGRDGMVVGFTTHYQQYFSYIVAGSFIDGGNCSTRRKPLTCRMSLRNFIT
jgi:hypothetical protein